MKKNVRLFAFLLAIIMTFTLTGCGEFSANPSTAHPTGSVPTTSTAGNYTAEDIAALITRLKTATSTTVGNYTAAMDLITGDFEARPEGTDSDEFRQMEADLVQTRDARLAALDAMIKVLEGLDPSATDAVAAKIAEAERMISEEHHVYGEKIPHSRNPEGTSCTEADHYQICTQCNAVTWTKGEHQWFYSRNMEDHQKCCRLCDATEPKAQHDTNDQGKCSVCNYKMNANILIIESIAGESSKLSSMIASNHSLTVVGISDSARMPASIDELKVYDEVILVNVANRDMPEGFAELLQKYVQQFGGGLLTVGGNTADSTPDDWKANAYDRTDLEGTIYQDMLPVEITETVASIGVMIIIDRSGSMWYQMDGQPYEESKFYAAKQGAAACVDMLQAGDYLGILSLGDEYDTPELIPITQKDKILNEIDNVNFGGSTIFQGALEVARQALLANTKVQRRHIILITDGEPADRNPGMYLEEARLNAEAGITMSVVGVDCTIDCKRQMIKLVKAGGGEETHFYDVGADSDGGYDSGVANATREALRCDELRKVIYADYTPTIPGANDTAGSISPEQLPTLGGAYHNQLKEGATEILHSPYGPLYAHWNYGKGMVGSFMCDLNGTWSADFLNAEAGATIINNIISHLANERIPDDSASPVVGNQVGDLCPSVQLSVLTGDGVSARTIDPSKLGKITIIYFWGAWCGPCKAELPFFDEVASMFPDQVDVIAIHSIAFASDGSEYITKNYPNSKIIFAVDNKCDETDIAGIRGEFFLTLGFHDIYPATVILDENGMIIYSGCKNFHSVEDLLAELPNSLLEDTQANK